MKYTRPQLAKSALVTIDTQCDFSLPGAAAEIPGTIAAIPNIKSLLTVYRQYGLPIIHIVLLYLPDGSNADLCRKDTIETGTHVIVPGTAGSELVKVLKPTPSV